MGDCHQFASRHSPRKKALNRKRIDSQEGVKNAGTASRGG